MALVASLPSVPSGGGPSIRIEGPSAITMIANTWYELAKRDKDRVYTLVFTTKALGDVFVSPGGTASGYGWHVDTNLLYLLLHAASYPGLADGDLYIRATVGGDIYVTTAHLL